MSPKDKFLIALTANEHNSGVWLILLVVTIFIGLLGYLSLRRMLYQVQERENSLAEFGNHLTTYLESGLDNSVAYAQLISNVDKMQNHMGSIGYLSVYRAPYSQSLIYNFPLLLMGLPRVRTLHTSNISHDEIRVLLEYIYDALIRHEAQLKRQKDRLNKSAKSPLVWYREGIVNILSIPFYILTEFGLMRSASSSLQENCLFRLIASLIALVTFIATIVGFLVDFEPFKAILQKWLSI